MTRTFDINLTVNNIDPTNVTGFHIHRAPFGVNGPIIIDLSSLGPLVPSGSGFTFSATGVMLDPQHEAALLGGITYINVHTSSPGPNCPNGLIRGQIFPAGLFVAAQGTTRNPVGAISNVNNVENVTGSSAVSGQGFWDSLVGDLNGNVLNGDAGNDTIPSQPDGYNCKGVEICFSTPF